MMTRKFLQGLGIEGGIIDKIMQANGEDIEREKAAAAGLREENSNLRLEASGVMAELEELKAALGSNSAEDEAFKAKYEAELAAHAETKKALRKEFDDYKQAAETEKAAAAKKAALRRQLAADGAHSKAVDLLELKFDISEIELDGGLIKDWESVSKPVKEAFADFFGETVIEGVNPASPPKGKSVKQDMFLDGFDGK